MWGPLLEHSEGHINFLGGYDSFIHPSNISQPQHRSSNYLKMRGLLRAWIKLSDPPQKKNVYVPLGNVPKEVPTNFEQASTLKERGYLSNMLRFFFRKKKTQILTSNLDILET